jgi:membrane carboxypeptidase/penicillin-binding protein PbpC
MWASEDSFLKHRGISEALLGKAIAIDLSTGRFTYGGSTITQQLVKNLYLKRTKALSRKFEEMIIVWQMERLLGKMKILEIYLNAVEFGPKVYGITRAAYEFFQKRPGELRPKEATYLAIIKPSPRSGWGTMRAGGWGDWYEMKCGKYMDKLHVESIVSDEDYKRDFEEFGNWRPAWNPPARGAKGGK